MGMQKDRSPRNMNLKRYLTSSAFLTSGIIIFAGLVLVIGAVIGTLLYLVKVPEIYSIFGLAIAALFPMIASFFIILRREMTRPGLSPIKGWPAVLIGVVCLLLLIYAEMELITRIIQLFVG